MQPQDLNAYIDLDLKVNILTLEGIETFGWISDDYEMIRSLLGAVWIRMSQGTIEESVNLEENIETRVLNNIDESE